MIQACGYSLCTADSPGPDIQFTAADDTAELKEHREPATHPHAVFSIHSLIHGTTITEHLWLLSNTLGAHVDHANRLHAGVGKGSVAGELCKTFHSILKRSCDGGCKVLLKDVGWSSRLVEKKHTKTRNHDDHVPLSGNSGAGAQLTLEVQNRVSKSPQVHAHLKAI